MWARRHLARRAFVATRRRHYSKALPDYHSKVRAIPFAFSAEDAIIHVGPFASVAGYVGRSDKGPPNVPFTTVLASALAKYLPMSGFKPLLPTRIQPIYFPTWFVAAELEATAWLSESDPEGETTTIQFENLYLPGFGMDIGRILVQDRPAHNKLAKSFTPDLAHQWGLDVMCLPFNISPFDILDRTRSLSHADAIISENLRFSPQSVKMNLAAAYPVLLPVYLVQYISKEPWPPVTIILAAHGDPGLHYIHIPHSEAEDSVRLPYEELTSQYDYIEAGSTGNDVDICATVVNPTSDHTLSGELSLWLNDQFQQRNVPLSMVAKQPIDMEDPRIREWTTEEMAPVYSWLQMGRARSFVKNTWLKTMNLDESQIIVKPARKEPKFVVDLLKSFLKPDAEWQAARAAATPEWWRKWQEGQKSRRPVR